MVSCDVAGKPSCLTGPFADLRTLFLGLGIRQRELQVQGAMTLPEEPGGIGASGMPTARATSCSEPHLTHSLTHDDHAKVDEDAEENEDEEGTGIRLVKSSGN